MITVVIPLYNKETSIAQSLKSVLSQEYDDFEVVIVDDGSTDGSVGVVEAINDSRIRLIKQENGGPSKARNTGVKNAKGEWILFLDADDEMLPEALRMFRDAINSHPEFNFIDFSWYADNGQHRIIADNAKEGKIKNPFLVEIDYTTGNYNISLVGRFYNKILALKNLLENNRQKEFLKLIKYQFKNIQFQNKIFDKDLLKITISGFFTGFKFISL